MRRMYCGAESIRYREIKRVLEVGYVRGADAWHLACALYLFADPDDATFLTLDRRQRAATKKLGFAV